MVADAIEAGTLETVLDDFAPRPMGIYAVRSGRGATPRLIAALIEAIAAHDAEAAQGIKQRDLEQFRAFVESVRSRQP